MEEGRKLIRDYIKDELLNGVMLNDTTGVPRADVNTSLAEGELRKSVFSRFDTKGQPQARMFFGVRGSEQLHYIANALMQGRHKTWAIVASHETASGKPGLLKYFSKKSGNFAFARRVEHHGYDAHPFIERGIKDNEPKLRQLIRDYINREVKA